MADPPAYPDADDTGGGPDRGAPPGMPRWVKVFGIIALVLALLFVVVMLVSGGQHGPWRHTSGGQAAGVEAPPEE